MTTIASEALHARVRRMIRSGAGDFDALACDVARFQARAVAPVARLFAAEGLDPARLERAEQIPALPADAFRLRRVAAHPEAEDERCFFTSGTTAALRGRHPMHTTETYRLAALTWGRALLFPDRERMRLIALTADEATAPESSLVFMLARFGEVLGEASFHFDGERLDVDGVLRALETAREPVLLAGTSFAFVHLLDSLRGSIPLPPASRILHTGGFKGRAREVAPDELRAAMAAAFELDPAMVIGEYGMTELSSQLYQASLREHVGAGAGAAGYLTPPWVRVAAVDPESLAPLPAGRIGIARIVDLANVDSAVAVQTADRVRVLADGSIELLGRAPGAPPRGCSLALEHLLEER